MSDLAALQEALGVSVNDLSLLEHALIHSSYIHENPGLSLSSNERLEFLGDAVLDLIIAEQLYLDHPGSSEGEMTRRRAALVSGTALARIAGGIDLGRYLYLGKGEQASGGRRKPSNLACALEAVIAAVYLDGGPEAARKLVLRLFRDQLAETNEDTADFKTRLQELAQAKWQLVPEYRVVETAGPAHKKQFSVEVITGGRVLGRGTGRSKRLAEQAAARAALEDLPDTLPPDRNAG